MNYVSDGLPNIKEFGVEEMCNKEMSRFLKWYENENMRLMDNGEKYDLRKLMKRYCYDDRYVLANAFGRFNESMISELLKSNVKDIVPHQYMILADFITLPQLVIHWYVGTSRPSRSLAIVPNGGYDSGKCGSLKENVWLMYLDKLHVIRSRYCSGQGQKLVDRYHLDGLRVLNDGSRECYEFYGCYYHGCPPCFPDRLKVIRRKHHENGFHTVEMAYWDTILREIEIKSKLKFEVGFDKWITIWEHEYNDKERVYREFLNGEMLYGLIDKLNARDSVKGGRTEVFRMYCNVRDPQHKKIQYLDVNSLYPYVMSEIEFPLGHSEIRRGNYSCRNLFIN